MKLTLPYSELITWFLQLAADSGDAAQAQIKGIEQRLEELQLQHTEFLEKEAELER